MNEPMLFQIVTAVLFAVVLELLMAVRKQPARGQSQPRAKTTDGREQGMDPVYCFNDCMRIQGQSKDMFCGVACGFKETG